MINHSRLHVSSKLVAILCVAIFFASFFFILQNIQIEKTKEIEIQQVSPAEYYGGIKILAKSAYVFDYTDQQSLFGLNENTPRPIASLTKIMSVPLALETLGDDSIVVIPNKADLESESDYDLELGAKWNIQALADFTLLGSSDVGAEVLQDAVDAFLKTTNSPFSFVDLMNSRASELGLLHTNFLNASGLDINKTQPGATGTARDMLNLVGALLPEYSALFSQTTEPSATFYDLSGRKYVVANTNTTLAELSPVLFSKTGYTDLAGGNLLIVYQSHGKMIGICVLGSTYDGRFTDVITLKEETEVYLNAVQNQNADVLQ